MRFTPFDASEFLDSEEAIAEYLAAALADPDPDLFVAVLGVTQPRISDLMRGRIDLFAIESLVTMLAAAGLQVELRVARAA